MAGMYPDNETLELFSEPVSWPGVDKDGKFTNGSFDDPMVRPSFIPSETVNLILDNLSEFLVSLNKSPNNKDSGQLALAVASALALKANLASPAFTGTPTAPTAAVNTNNTQIATTAFVLANTSNSLADTSTTKALSAAKGKELQDGKAPLASPAFTGTPTAPTPTNTPSSPAAKNIITIEYLNNLVYPVGTSYAQGPNDPTPVEAGLPGDWENWSARAEIYGIMSSSLPSYSTYSSTASYAANAYVLYQPTGGDKRIYRAKAAVAAGDENNPERNPLLWYQIGESGSGYTSVIRVSRRSIQTSWTAADLTIGGTVSGGTYNGYRVVEVIAAGGKFPSIEGGNRPAFISGGAGWDEMRNFPGGVAVPHWTNLGASTGPFKNAQVTATILSAGTAVNVGGVDFDPSLVVPTGNENSPRTLTARLWRRVA